jgi:hypothetical protein
MSSANRQEDQVVRDTKTLDELIESTRGIVIQRVSQAIRNGAPKPSPATP